MQVTPAAAAAIPVSHHISSVAEPFWEVEAEEEAS